jgi:6-phosphogluconate dehydrogenase
MPTSSSVTHSSRWDHLESEDARIDGLAETGDVKIGMVGLGRMGANMTERLRSRDHDVIGYDRNPETSEVASLDELVGSLERPRTIWCMVPSGDPTEETISALAELLDEGDLVVDGGNSYFRDSLRRGEELDGRGILFCDAGVSGGIWGLADGYCLMVGGNDEAIQRLEPALVALAQEGGYAHVGPVGTGHFVKMVHNGIEYGLLQAYGEGFQLLQASAEFPDLDLSQIAEVWRRGSVVRSWLLDLAARALEQDPGLDGIRGYVEDSGEGRWTVLEAVRSGVPVPAIADSLFARFDSRDDDPFAMKLIAALRQQFGGHGVKER